MLSSTPASKPGNIASKLATLGSSSGSSSTVTGATWVAAGVDVGGAVDRSGLGVDEGCVTLDSSETARSASGRVEGVRLNGSGWDAAVLVK